MDLLTQYSDDEEGGEDSADAANDGAHEKRAAGAQAKAAARPGGARWSKPEALALMLPTVNGAPEVDTFGALAINKYALDPAQKHILNNPSIEALYKPLQGPSKPGDVSLESKFRNHKMGHLEKCHMSKFGFHEEYVKFQNYGYAANPQRAAGVDSLLLSTEATPVVGATPWDKPKKRRRLDAERLASGGVAPLADQDEDEEHDIVQAEKLPPSDKWGGFADEGDRKRRLDEENKTREAEVVRQAEEERREQGEEPETKERHTTVFHGTKELDFQGRSWIENKTQIPKDVDERQCFMPKKWIHTWSGHTMGVQAIRLFPKTAHLLLSAGMDAKIKIWDFHNQRKCLRDYTGHDQAVRDINFTDDGRRFYSVSFDKNIQYWDTETGKIIGTYTNKKTPYCVSVNPDLSKQNEIITGCSNKKAVQWDMNSGQIVQEYDEHLGAVNTVTWCEEGRKIVTTSDDKKIFVWEYGIPVVVKYIAEETMHSVPSMVLSPDKKFMLGQSMDNKIICYEATGRFKFVYRKQFKGHLNAGYAIKAGWSTDQKWIMSGDSDGKLWFWDWGKQKNHRVIKAHDGVIIDCLWHPVQTSKVITAGWDGAIKLWD